MGKGEAGSKTSISPEQWEKKLADIKIPNQDINKLVMNFLITEGYLEAAQEFSKEAGISPTVDLDTITGRMHIRQAVQSGLVEEAIDQVNDMNPEILETQPKLLFHLHQQQLVELIRQGKVSEALEFAGEYMAHAGQEHPELLEDLERTIALLAFSEPCDSPLSELLSLAQRHKTASELNGAILESQHQDRESRLPQVLRLLQWAQEQLSEKANFPKITNLSTAQLETAGVD